MNGMSDIAKHRRPGRHVPIDLRKLNAEFDHSGLSRAEFAARLEMSRAAVTQILNGQRGVSRATFGALVHVLDVAPSRLMPDPPEAETQIRWALGYIKGQYGEAGVQRDTDGTLLRGPGLTCGCPLDSGCDGNHAR